MQSADDAEHTKWGGLSPPYLQLGGAEAPPAPPVPTPLNATLPMELDTGASLSLIVP